MRPSRVRSPFELDLKFLLVVFDLNLAGQQQARSISRLVHELPSRAGAIDRSELTSPRLAVFGGQ
jgi:hypothetical protein